MNMTFDNADNLVVLQTFENATQAEIAKSVLDGADIFCVLHGDILSSIYPIGSFSTRLMVRESDVNVAKQVLFNEE